MMYEEYVKFKEKLKKMKVWADLANSLLSGTKVHKRRLKYAKTIRRYNTMRMKMEQIMVRGRASNA